MVTDHDANHPRWKEMVPHGAKKLLQRRPSGQHPTSTDNAVRPRPRGRLLRQRGLDGLAPDRGLRGGAGALGPGGEHGAEEGSDSQRTVLTASSE